MASSGPLIVVAVFSDGGLNVSEEPLGIAPEDPGPVNILHFRPQQALEVPRQAIKDVGDRASGPELVVKLFPEIVLADLFGDDDVPKEDVLYPPVRHTRHPAANSNQEKQRLGKLAFMVAVAVAVGVVPVSPRMVRTALKLKMRLVVYMLSSVPARLYSVSSQQSSKMYPTAFDSTVRAQMMPTSKSARVLGVCEAGSLDMLVKGRIRDLCFCHQTKTANV